MKTFLKVSISKLNFFFCFLLENLFSQQEFVLVDGSIKPAKRGKTEEVCEEEEEEEEEGSKKRKRREENEIDGEKGPKKPRTEED